VGEKMLKRYNPDTQPNGTKTEWSLPSAYIGGTVTIFINGQMLAVQNKDDEYYGFTVDEDNKILTFYTAPLDGDFLYILYDSDGTGDSASDYSGTGLMRLETGFNLISYQGMKNAHWNTETKEVTYTDGILANVKNLIIDQIESVYGVLAKNIVREIQTFETDTGKYRTFNTTATSPAWCGTGEHVRNKDLYRAAEDNEYGDPDDGDYVVYNPNNFILSNCYIDTEDDNTIKSLDIDNNLVDLPSGLRTGILIYVYPDADLSKTDDRLEIWF
jgi:hypothetical protein